jgi:ribose transport system ATP-binding protein
LGNNGGVGDQPDRQAALIDIRSLSKSFPGQVALSDVSMQILPGQIHALVGQNGSGKSTLIKILAGYHQPDPGAEVVMRGESVDIGNLSAPQRAHLHVMHQDLGLVPTLSIMENLALGRGYETGFAGRINWGRERTRVKRLLAEFEVDADPRALVGSLPAAEQSIVALVRALQDWERDDVGERGQGLDLRSVLVLDEPTASLPRPEVERLFAAVRRVAQRGGGVVFVSHRLDEVFELADYVTVLRDGKVVGSQPLAELDHARLIELIVGRAIDELYASPPEPKSEVALEATDLAGNDLIDLDLIVRRGEVVGVAGLVGSGRDELASLLFGAEPLVRGAVRVNGQTVSNPRGAVTAGMALVPADRKGEGCIPSHSVRENVMLPRLAPFGRWWLRRTAERQAAQEWVSKVELRPADPERAIITLSGGNQQKAVLARWLRTEPAVLVLDEPTQGVDVGAKASIYELLASSAATGTAVVMCSSDAEELAHVCDRVLVLRSGRLATELSGASLTSDRIVQEILS